MYVRGKLATDPVYDAVYQHLRGSDDTVIDIADALAARWVLRVNFAHGTSNCNDG